MTAKTLEVALKLNLGNMRAGLGAAAGDVKSFGKSLDEALPPSHQTKLDKIGTGALVAGTLVLAGFGLAAKSAMEFDKQLSELQAVSGATGEALGALRQQAIDAGASTVFSAGEAAQAQVELAKAGVSTADILGGALTGALNLASAGSLDLATAAAIAAQTMTTFGLKGADVGRIADALAAGANKSAADVGDLAQGLAQSGLVANQFGLSMEETVGTLSLFSQNALNGSDAGTSLKTMLLRLGAPIGDAKDRMQELGLSMFDGNGKVRDFADVADDLQAKLGNMSDAERAATLTTIFGSDAIRAANIVYKAGGDGIRDWTEQVSAQGYASDLAAQKTDNLAGDLEALQGTIETALITSGEKGQGALRSLAQGANDLVQGLMAMSSTGQNTVLAIAGIGAAAAVVVGTIIKLRAAMTGLGVSLSLGPAAGIVLAASAAVAIFGSKLIESGQAAAEAKSRVDAYVQAAGNVEKSLKAQAFQASDAAKLITEAGLSWSDFGEAIRSTDAPFERFRDNAKLAIAATEKAAGSGSGAVKEFTDDLNAAAETGDKFAISLKAMVESGQITKEQANAIGVAVAEQSDAMKEANRQTEIAASIDPKSAEGKKKIAEAAKQTAEEIDNLKDSLDALIGKMVDEPAAFDAILQDFNDLKQSAADYVASGHNIGDMWSDTSNEAINLRNQYRGLIEDAGTSMKLWADQGLQGQALTDKVNGLAQGYFDLAMKSGLGAQKAGELRDSILVMGAQVDSASGKVAGLHGWLSSLPKGVSTSVSAPGADNLLGVLADLKARLDRLGGSSAHPEIQALIDQGSFNQANAALNSLARTRMANIITNVGRSVGNWLHMDGGGIIAAARGLEVGPHSAEMAGLGAVRWREPDTQGEGYVPFANDWRRPGAQRVWGQIGRRIGMLGPVPAAPTPQTFAGVPAASGGDRYSFVMPVSVSVPNYVGDQTEFTRAVASAVKSTETAMRTAIAEAVRRAGR